MPDNQPTNWRRDLFVIPLLVGLLVAVGTFFLPKLFVKGKRLTYEIDGPNSYVNTTAIPGVAITLNGSPVANLYGYRVRLWNSGDASITNLPVQCRFSPTSPDFKILSVKHETIPQQEFGKIDEQGSDNVSKRFVYELLNPVDEDTITLVTNQEASFELYAKTEGLQIDRKKEEETSRLWQYAPIAVVILSSLASLLTTGLKAFAERTTIWRSGKP